MAEGGESTSDPGITEDPSLTPALLQEDGMDPVNVLDGKPACSSASDDKTLPAKESGADFPGDSTIAIVPGPSHSASEQITAHTRGPTGELQHRLETVTDELSRAGTTEEMDSVAAKLRALSVDVVTAVGHQAVLGPGAPRPTSSPPSKRKYIEIKGPDPGSRAESPRRVAASAGLRGAWPADSNNNVPTPYEVERANLQAENRALRLRIGGLLQERSQNGHRRPELPPWSVGDTPYGHVLPADRRPYAQDRDQLNPWPNQEPPAFQPVPGVARLDAPRIVTPAPPATPVLGQQSAGFLAGATADGGRDSTSRTAAIKSIAPSSDASARRDGMGQPPLGSRHRLNDLQLKAFEGNDGEWFDRWIDQDWRAYFEYNRLDLLNDSMRAYLLRSKLGTRAQQYLDANIPRDGQLAYERMIELLKERYSQRTVQTAAKLKFQSRDREATEPIDVYVDALRYLYHQAYEGTSDRDAELAVIERTLKGIDPEMAARVDENWAILEEKDRTTSRLIGAVQHLEMKRATAATSLNVQRRQQSVPPLTRFGSNTSVDSVGSASSFPGTRNRRYDGNNNVQPSFPPRPPPRPATEIGAATGAAFNPGAGLDSTSGTIVAPPVSGTARQLPKPPAGYSGCYICKSMEHYARECSHKAEVKFMSSLTGESVCTGGCHADCIGHLVCANCGDTNHMGGDCDVVSQSAGPTPSQSGNV